MDYMHYCTEHRRVNNPKGRSKVKVPPESRTSLKCNHLFLGPLSIFLENFTLFFCFANKESDRQTDQ